MNKHRHPHSHASLDFWRFIQKSILAFSIPLNIVKLLLFILFISISFPLNSLQADSTIRLVRVGVYENKPIVFENRPGNFNGIAMDVLRYIATKEGWQLQLVPGTWSDQLDNLGKGRIDLLVGIGYNEERNKKYRFTRQTLLSNWGVLYKYTGVTINSPLNLEGKRLALLRDSIHSVYFEKTLKGFGVQYTPVYVDNYQDALHLLQKHSVHAAVTNRLYGTLNAAQYDLVQTDIAFNPIGVHYAAPHNTDAHLINTIDGYLMDLKADKNSLYQKSIDNWLSADHQHALPKWISITIAIFILLVLGIILVGVILKQQIKKKTAAYISINKDLQKEIDNHRNTIKVLSDTERKYRDLFENANDAIFVVDNEYRYVDVNKRAVELFGYSKEEYLQMSIFDVIPEEQQQRSEKELKRLSQAGGYEKFEGKMRCKDGRWRDVEVNSSAIIKDGKIIGSRDIVRDVTDRKKLEQDLRQAQKMEAIGTLAGGIAHDFNNILYAIHGNAELTLLDAEPGSQIHKNAKEIIKASQRAAKLIKQILTFSRKTEHEKQPIPLQPIVKEALQLLRNTIPSTITIKNSIDPSCGEIIADLTQVHQVIINLCTNAYQAMRNRGGTLEVELREMQLTADDLEPFNGLMPGAYACLTVKDSGHGMTPQTIERIFEPYFTTKGLGEGTGLGLATVLGIVHSHHGAIKVESEPDAGSTFTVFFPIAIQQA